MGEPALQTAAPAARPPSSAAGSPRARVETDKLTAMYGKFTAVKGVSLAFPANRVHALIGPSGCGKSTFLRALNRMHELSEHGWITGRVLLDGEDIYAPRVNAMQLRRRIGMVFQRPTPFPTMSIYDNVAAGLRVHGRLPRAELDGIVERSLQQAALWDEVKDRLRASAMALSGGQQQRLCLARTIAPSPEVVLLDEPTASLDPQGTQRIDEFPPVGDDGRVGHGGPASMESILKRSSAPTPGRSRRKVARSPANPAPPGRRVAKFTRETARRTLGRVARPAAARPSVARTVRHRPAPVPLPTPARPWPRWRGA